MKRLFTLLIGAGLAASLSSPALAAEPTMEELLNATDDIARGDSSIAVITMNVKTERYERTVTMKAWSRGTEESLILIEAPAKEKGTATLKVEDNIWNYLPKVDRTIKVPASMMGGSWMGSHFSNDDLVKENRLSEEFTGEITAKPADESPEGVYKIELTPKPDAPVVWGKIEVEVRADKIPVETRFYDEKGELVRTMSFEDVKDYSGRMVPARMRITPADKPGEYTEVIYDSLEFDAEIPDSTFSLQALRR